MIRRSFLFALVPVLLAVGLASAQEYPLMELIAKKVIEKYQTSFCQELAMQKSHPPTGQQAHMEQRAVQACGTIRRCGRHLSTVWRLLSPTNCSSAA